MFLLHKLFVSFHWLLLYIYLLLLLHNNLFVLSHSLHLYIHLDRLSLLILRLYNNFRLYKLHNYLLNHNLHYVLL
ncbi:hypothetical protein FACS189475_04240 [Betaproteobacteria bacterium]|nr:hypothetical protein FACS189475_04240 [Betaproteobacteria bacterium]